MKKGAIIGLDKDSKFARVSSTDLYVKPLWEQVLKEHSISLVDSPQNVPSGTKLVEIGEYDDLDVERLMSDSNYFACTYIYRKALIRKHYLGYTIERYISKNPTSALAKAFPTTYNIEVDYAEFLDDALDETYGLREELEEGRKTWILKPSMSDRGQGIRIFKTVDELQQIFEEFEEENESDIEDEEPSLEEEGGSGSHGIITSQLRHFVVQEYISRPLLLPAHGNRKFHIRTYVLCVGAIKVYVYKDMLALFSHVSYQQPEAEEDGGILSLVGQLTNTCLQGSVRYPGTVHRFWNLEYDEDKKQKIFDDICEITGELFKAATSVDRINFQPLPNAYEIYGLDFLVNGDDNSVSILEVNAYPDFKQTGDDLNNVILNLFRSTYNLAIKGFYGDDNLDDDDRSRLVLEQDLSGGW
ncbi:Pby1p [Sugiyamaella lignohabitans]|uniref:Pby1p n=1 Tax=Sugiyamaella lignohabitans TaxID=796027 RepID=A0A161HI25_9ASCO|nr:Pby1p [Sugiyamaella lignohabitans]ANB15870.1 Pby1p [Sugiyamaella lignohabitans]